LPQAAQAKLNHKLPHATTGDPDDRRIRVAILSAHPLANITKIRPFPPGVRAVQTKDKVFDDPNTPVDESVTGEMGRGSLAAAIQVNGTPVTVVTAHFKSKLINYARKQGVVGGSRFAPNDEGAAALRRLCAVSPHWGGHDRPRPPRPAAGRPT
jgi:hypothetical protein